MASISRNLPLIEFLIIIILIPIGLLTKTYSGFGSELVKNYLGGIFYVVFFIMLASLVFHQITPFKISLIVFGFTCLIEFSQLIQTDFLNGLRDHFVIRALIGSSFNIFDFISYFIGALIGFVTLQTINKRNTYKG